ncbi:MAG: PH domain-containing protein [archaeon]|nr:PH domain-containing protein [archaeon]
MRAENPSLSAPSPQDTPAESPLAACMLKVTFFKSNTSVSSKKVKYWAELRRPGIFFFKSKGSLTTEVMIAANQIAQVTDLGMRQSSYVVTLLNSSGEMIASLFFSSISEHASWKTALSMAVITFQASLSFCYALSEPSVNCLVEVSPQALQITCQSPEGQSVLVFRAREISPRFDLAVSSSLQWLQFEGKGALMHLGSANPILLRSLRANLEQLAGEPALPLLSSAAPLAAPSASLPASSSGGLWQASPPRPLADASSEPCSSLPPLPEPNAASRIRFFKLHKRKVGSKNLKPADWRKVYVTCDSRTLTYYTQKSSKHEQGTIVLSTILSCEELPVWTNPLTRTTKVPLFVKLSDRSHVFAWKTVDERASWSSKFTAHLASTSLGQAALDPDSTDDSPERSLAAHVDVEAIALDQKLRKTLLVAIPNLMLVVLILIYIAV